MLMRYALSGILRRATSQKRADLDMSLVTFHHKQHFYIHETLPSTRDLPKPSRVGLKLKGVFFMAYQVMLSGETVTDRWAERAI
jgi:hypothetical protein